jgi:hypothetical protein
MTSIVPVAEGAGRFQGTGGSRAGPRTRAVQQLDPEAAGLVPQHDTPQLLNGLQQFLVEGMNTAAVSVHDTADSVRSVAAAYDTADGNAADRLNGTR